MKTRSHGVRKRIGQVVVVLFGSLVASIAGSVTAQESLQDPIQQLLPELPDTVPGDVPQPSPVVPPNGLVPNGTPQQPIPITPPGGTLPGLNTPQPPPSIPPQSQPQLPRQNPFRLANVRLARAPSLFGDFFNPPLTLVFNEGGATGAPNLIAAQLPASGALRRTKISDNGRALPTDRVYFLYNHFNNAVETPSLDPTGQFFGRSVRESVDRYTFGYERTFFSEGGSVELRVPFASPTDINVQPQFDTGVIVPGQEFGNMNVAFKGLVHETSNFASAIGLAVDIPTGEDVDGVLDMPPPGSMFPGDVTMFHIENETVYLQPFVAALLTPSDRIFVQSFILVDIPVGGDRVTMADPAVGTTDLGRLEYATFLHVDVAVGRWLIQDSPGLVRGLAGVVEFHSSPMVSDPGSVAGNSSGFTLALGQPDRLNLLSLTAGLHAQLGENTTLRVGGVFPLQDRPDRTFDAELLVQVNRFLR